MMKVIIDCTEYYELASEVGKHIVLRLPLEELTRNVYSSIGEVLPLCNSTTKGFLNISMTVPSIYDAACGWFSRIEQSPYGEAMSTYMWTVMNKSELSFYESPYGGENSLLSRLDCKAITGIHEIVFDKLDAKVGAFELRLASSRENLILAWPNDSMLKTFWYRALVHQILFGQESAIWYDCEDC